MVTTGVECRGYQIAKCWTDTTTLAGKSNEILLNAKPTGIERRDYQKARCQTNTTTLTGKTHEILLNAKPTLNALGRLIEFMRVTT